jgi:hypothetical protein
MTTNNDQEEVIRTLEDEQLTDSEKIKALYGGAAQSFMLHELG